MKFTLKLIGILTSAFLGICLFFFILGGFIFGWDRPSCDEDSEAVRYARSLSEERLELLYHQMHNYSLSEDTPFGGYSRLQNNELPYEFNDLEVVKVRPKQGDIMVQGCFDHYVYLGFSGLNDSLEKEIVLSYGEFPVLTEVLWRSE
ncbi:hypothetical protein JF535_15540 [Microbulbifer salipaludis]|uniref:Uncharacterized protein n=1 Tax=Microbulbifer salipaludis TaxID=187980 RepID=A0ABS3EAC5_9GAMM|nr:hypothetical protein [Microbulbifer salipaludis]MBN8432261.1 hypothetical protein [Microbulbifer salipaludis]